MLNISGNGLLPDGTKPLPEPMLTYHQSGLVAFTWRQFHTKCSIYLSLIRVWKLLIWGNSNRLCSDNEIEGLVKSDLVDSNSSMTTFFQCLPTNLHSRVQLSHCSDIIMSMMACQITSLTIVYSTVYSGTDQRKHQSCASLVFVQGIHRSPVNSPHKGPVMGKMFPFHDVIMNEWIN